MLPRHAAQRTFTGAVTPLRAAARAPVRRMATEPPARNPNAPAFNLRPSFNDLRHLPVPPISQRLRPLVPFLIWWSIITSLAVHMLHMRRRGEEETARAEAQQSVLQSLIQRFENGQVVSDVEIRRELEMVGLRERTELTADLTAELTELRDVGWWEVILGRKNRQDRVDAAQGVVPLDSEDQAVEEWTQIVKEATTTEPAPELQPTKAREGVARRAATSNVYL